MTMEKGENGAIIITEPRYDQKTGEQIEDHVEIMYNYAETLTLRKNALLEEIDKIDELLDEIAELG